MDKNMDFNGYYSSQGFPYGYEPDRNYPPDMENPMFHPFMQYEQG